MSRFNVQSADGTSLAVWVNGEGPPIVLVHGSLGDHTRWDVPAAELRDTVTTFAMDRRGFGASGDTAGYAIEREFEDVAAVVDAVATRSGEPVALWGHSYGANCAMGGAALTNNVWRLVLYEPSLGLTYPAGSVDAVEQAVAARDLETAVVLAFCELLEMTEEEVDAQRAGPLWPMRLATAPTLPRECRTEEGWEVELASGRIHSLRQNDARERRYTPILARLGPSRSGSPCTARQRLIARSS